MEEEIKKNWQTVKNYIRREYLLTDASYTTWVEPLECYCVNDSTVTVVIPADKEHMADYISAKYKTFFQVTLTEMFGNHNFDINFVLESDIEENTEKAPSPINPNYENANLNPKYKFDTFVVGSNNNLAHSAALAVAESPGKIYNPLYLYGGPGLGKTHLMHSIGSFILDQTPEKKVIYVTSEDFTNEVIESIRSGNATTMTKLREKYRTVDVLMIDDIQFIIGKESTQEFFFHTFNTLYSANKHIILSSDKPPKDLETLDDRFRSRFAMGLTADIQPPDYETRMAILRKNAEIYNKKIDEEIIKYIATNITTNIRELEGAFNQIIAFSKLYQIDLEDMTPESAEEALKDLIYPNKAKKLTFESITNIVAEQYGVTVENILSKRRTAEIVQARQVTMYLCRKLLDTSLSQIGTFLGNRDHTTVIHGINSVESELKSSDEMKTKIDVIIKKINPS